MRGVEERERLVGSRVERAHDDLLAGEEREQLGVLRLLLGDRRRGLRVEEQELGAEQAHALGAELDGLGAVLRGSDVREQGDLRTVGKGAVDNRDRGGGGAGRDAGVGVGDERLIRVGGHETGCRVDDDDGAVGEVEDSRDADDRGNRLRAREDRRVAGRAAVARDEAQHLVEVEQGGVGRSEIRGDEDERGVTRGNAGCGHAAQVGDDALRDIPEVSGTLGHVAAHTDEQLLERGERLEHGALARGTAVDAGLHVIAEGRVLRPSWMPLRAPPGLRRRPWHPCRRAPWRRR